MKAIVLAAGYATRLRPLTDTVAKPLLPLAGRPMVDFLCDRIDEVEEIDRIHVVTNARFAPQFEEWALARAGRTPVVVHDDGTITNDDRLGAIGDLRFVVERAGLAGEHLLVVAGDNLFEFSLADYVGFWRGKGTASALAVHDVRDLELVKQYGVVTVGEGDRVVRLVEKPDKPDSTLAATATYLFHADHAALVRQYLEAGNSPDQPGLFLAWLHTREPVFAWRFGGRWLDIGNREQLVEADNFMRDRAGLPRRAEYALD